MPPTDSPSAGPTKCTDLPSSLRSNNLSSTPSSNPSFTHSLRPSAGEIESTTVVNDTLSDPTQNQTWLAGCGWWHPSMKKFNTWYVCDFAWVLSLRTCSLFSNVLGCNTMFVCFASQWEWWWYVVWVLVSESLKLIAVSNLALYSNVPEYPEAWDKLAWADKKNLFYESAMVSVMNCDCDCRLLDSGSAILTKTSY